MPSGVKLIPKPASLHSDEYKRFLEHLRAVRLAAGMTQQQIADQLNKPQSYVSKCQSGERRMDIVEIHAFCVAMNKPVDEFVREWAIIVKRPKR